MFKYTQNGAPLMSYFIDQNFWSCLSFYAWGSIFDNCVIGVSAQTKVLHCDWKVFVNKHTMTNKVLQYWLWNWMQQWSFTYLITSPKYYFVHALLLMNFNKKILAKKYSQQTLLAIALNIALCFWQPLTRDSVNSGVSFSIIVTATIELWKTLNKQTHNY